MSGGQLNAKSKLVIAIIAKNEQQTIGPLIESLASQSIFQCNVGIDLIVLANGCSDNTAQAARDAAKEFLEGLAAKVDVFEAEKGGKSRSWNKLVHDLSPSDADLYLFVDADIALAHSRACEEVVGTLLDDPQAVACVGRPTKSIAAKNTKSFSDRLSLQVSEEGRFDRAINGSLYCIRGPVAREIWLPDDTPGEDGFLNAMVRTGGFSHPDRPQLVTQVPRTTHYYHAPGWRGTRLHEQRMVVATMINIWIFEHFQSMQLVSSAAPLIAAANRDNPSWVGEIIRDKSARNTWLIRRQLLLRRLPTQRSGGFVAHVGKLAIGIAATLYTVFIAARANAILHRKGAETYW